MTEPEKSKNNEVKDEAGFKSGTKKLT